MCQKICEMRKKWHHSFSASISFLSMSRSSVADGWHTLMTLYSYLQPITYMNQFSLYLHRAIPYTANLTKVIQVYHIHVVQHRLP